MKRHKKIHLTTALKLNFFIALAVLSIGCTRSPSGGGALGPTLTPFILPSVTPILPTETPLPETTSPQRVRWGTGEGYPPGICLDVCGNGKFIAWAELKTELESKMLPLVGQVPAGSRLNLILADSARAIYIVRVVAPNGSQFADVWLGGDPLAGWVWDGLIRVGPSTAPVQVWAVIQRYSDNSYRRVR